MSHKDTAGSRAFCYSDKLQTEIVGEVETSTLRDVKESIRWRYLWTKCSHSLEAIAMACMSVSSILSFAAGYYVSQQWISFLAGTIGTLSLAILRYSTYAKSESRERTKDLNAILERVNISPMPEAEHSSKKEQALYGHPHSMAAAATPGTPATPQPALSHDEKV